MVGKDLNVMQSWLFVV